MHQTLLTTPFLCRCLAEYHGLLHENQRREQTRSETEHYLDYHIRHALRSIVRQSTYAVLSDEVWKLVDFIFLEAWDEEHQCYLATTIEYAFIQIGLCHIALYPVEDQGWRIRTTQGDITLREIYLTSNDDINQKIRLMIGFCIDHQRHITPQLH